MKRKLQLYTCSCVLLLAVSCATTKEFEYRSMNNLKIETQGLKSTVLVMDLVYFNPNRFGVNLKKIDCEVYVDKQYIGKMNLDTTMHIPRSAEFVLPSRLSIDMKTIFTNTLPFLFNKEVLVQIKGTARAGKNGFYKTFPFTYEAKHKLSL